ncbi:hypothetical protein L204_103811 [Cryptococcus depauperatus]|nr:hypothetical protein L204_02966 [Cryptococcus depauperatus CBS 7855]
MPPTAPSPTLATPKPQASTLRPLIDPSREDTLKCEADLEDGDVKRLDETLKSSILHDLNDGRATPMADPSSAGASSSSVSNEPPSPNPTNISSISSVTFASQPTTLPMGATYPAEAGLGSLQGEGQLKSSLQSKDRMFMLVIAKEFEVFISRVASGQIPAAPQPATQCATTSTMAALGPSAPISATPSSKFQRMLVYKMAEWYGLKAVPGPDGTMIVGVLGTFKDKSTALRLADLVPATATSSPAQKFKIMQRTPISTDLSDSSLSSVLSSTESRLSKWKTLEEREAAYAAAREKIYGKNEDSDCSILAKSEEELPSRAAAALEDDIEPVPRRRYPNNNSYDLVYPSLYHPPKGSHSTSPTPNTSDQYGQQGQPYIYQPDINYSYHQVDMNGYPMPGPMMNSYQQGVPTQGYSLPQQSYTDGQYSMSQQAYTMPTWHQPSGQYPPPIIQNQQYEGGIQNDTSQVQQGGQWQYQPMMNQPMPMIPQGMPYPPAPAYGYSQQPQSQPPMMMMQQQRSGVYPPLVQPTPQRPQPQPHSSASSSISSRSYQDGSRPHSRGSTTSTKSATSSVRLGAIYPAGQGHGVGAYRQKGLKQQGLNGMASLGLENNGNGQKKNVRGHSPSSTTTTSSHSSRRASSIIVPPPSQHQLPQRPDWAANNIPYQPSPIFNNPAVVSYGGQPMLGNPNIAEFSPLLRSDTAAEPMQAERVKACAVTGAWNSTPFAVNSAFPIQVSGNASFISNTPLSEPRVTILPGIRAAQPMPSVVTPPRSMVEDPDFPKRMPGKSVAVLYDPRAPHSSQTNGQGQNQFSRPPSANANQPSTPTGVHVAQSKKMSPEEVIEAKLAVVSIKSGVSIGPPPNKSMQAASYAKVVKRD